MLTLGILYPNYKHIDGYRVPTVFNADEVKVLENLHQIADREDYVVAWWDYGYPIRYYADVKTLVDGGKHIGSVNFPVSYILTKPQEQAAKMARLDVEYTEKGFESNQTLSNIENMTLEYGFKDTNDFLFSLQTDIKLPQKTRDIYFYLPFKMLNIYPTVKVFSNMDLMSGEKGKQPFFFISRNFKDLGDKIALGNNVFMNKKDSTLNIGSNKVSIKRFVKTYYLKNGVLEKDVQVINPSAGISVIYMSNYNTFLVLDEETYNSLYIQLMVLEEYDKSLFEKVVASPHAKVYKLKI
jgi:dolichyl-diphosphooligosaccharide--protein glycosyltransferase/undecaprenyl-diphosphooligosaccharide--protein glycosyltransferase